MSRLPTEDTLMAKPVQTTTLYGTSAGDTIHAGAGNQIVYGNQGDDFLYGDDGDDELYGQEGSDTLNGGAGNDRLGWGGGGGLDTLTGGSGADTFFGGPWAWTDQQVDQVVITDFQSGTDKLDLTRFDADERTTPGIIKGNSTPGNEAFVVVSQTDGITPGQLVITTGTDELGRPITLVLGYTDTVPGADIELHLLGQTVTGGPVITGLDILL
jgi:hypothetical protein